MKDTLDERLRHAGMPGVCSSPEEGPELDASRALGSEDSIRPLIASELDCAELLVRAQLETVSSCDLFSAGAI